jgi:hypothetical protein
MLAMSSYHVDTVGIAEDERSGGHIKRPTTEALSQKHFQAPHSSHQPPVLSQHHVLFSYLNFSRLLDLGDGGQRLPRIPYLPSVPAKRIQGPRLGS